MGNLVIAGLPNYVDSPLTTFTCPSAAGTGANLAGAEPSDTERITTQDPAEAWWEIDIGSARSVRRIAIVNHSLVPGSSVRFIGDSGTEVAPSGVTWTSEIAPDSIVASTNLSGTLGNLSESPSNPGGTWVGPSTTTLPWMVHVSFGVVPSGGNPATGGGYGGYQLFAAWVRRVGTPTSAADYPTVTATLYESGGSVTALGTKSIQSATGQWVLFGWDAADLATASGANAEVRLDFTKGSGTVYGQMDALAWFELGEDDVATLEADSGWIEVAGAAPETDWGSTSVGEVGPLPVGMIIYRLPSAVNLQTVRIEYRDDGAGWHTDFASTPIRTPNGFIDTGLVVIGEIFTLPYNFSYGAGLRWEAYGAWHRRIAEVNFPVGSAAAHSILTRIDGAAAPVLEGTPSIGGQSRGTGGRPFLLELEPDATDTNTIFNTSFWCLARGRGIIYSPGQLGGDGWRDLSYVFEEKL